MRLGVICVLFAATVAAACGHPPSSSSPSPAAAPSNGVYAIALTASSPGSLPKCTSALAGTTAFVQSPVGLWSCLANAWVQIPCLAVAAGTVAYSSATQTLLACVAGQWTVVALPQGAAGATGPQGATALVNVTREPVSANCPAGGERVDVGVDTNASGALETGEIQKTTYVCNGAPGASGTPGTPGGNGASTLVVSSPEPAGPNCAGGGVKLSLGLDTNGNGALDGGEVMSVSYVCNGVAGSQGESADGGVPDGNTALERELDRCAADADCAAPLVCRALFKGGVQRCTRKCTTDSGCLSGERCFDDLGGTRTCLGEDTGRSCTSSDVCNFGCFASAKYCTSSCASGADCPNGWGCMAAGLPQKVCIKYETACGADIAECRPGVCDTTLVLPGCTGSCDSAADCPKRAAGLPAWTCDASGICRRPPDVFGPLGQSMSAAYACDALGMAANLCDDGQHINLATLSVPPPPALSCDVPAVTPGAPGDSCVDSCRYRGGCVFRHACVAVGSAGANRVALCMPTTGAGEGGEVGAPCDRHQDCAFGYCDRGLCSRDCTPDGVCPSGTSCQEGADGESIEGLVFRLCR